MKNELYITIDGNEWKANCKLGKYGTCTLMGYGDMGIMKINELLQKDNNNHMINMRHFEK
jgi:hypothetical protein